ncbi:hypothetical protein BN11_2530010 [Nostocoides australiense Ben110]|uniref:Uncharacterized protein n=1 Tax=Nostocoides australiense Ben110 TaxID=1193182 RepID=W6K3I0_9MICO|nr:hypothetical protein BN11_2530010 [Tetrasphaera australiensis Ben110]
MPTPSSTSPTSTTSGASSESPHDVLHSSLAPMLRADPDTGLTPEHTHLRDPDRKDP